MIWDLNCGFNGAKLGGQWIKAIESMALLAAEWIALILLNRDIIDDEILFTKSILNL